jgi:hypothetical protein
MNLKNILIVLFSCLSSTVFAQKDVTPKANIKLVSAFSKKIPESAQSNPPKTGEFFVVKWNESSYPESVFWRGQGGWLTCNIEKAVKKGKSYIGAPIEIEKIKRGQLLMFTPVTGGRFPIPAEIPENAKNTIFYKTAGSAWIAFPVKKISKK